MNSIVVIQECTFKAVRSSGAGGQHVNKVSSKIELSFDLLNSKGFSEYEKTLLQRKLKLSKEGCLLLQCSESRSQHKNKALVIKRFLSLLKKSLIVPKRRIPTKTPKRVIRKRLKNKKHQADKKNNRQKPSAD
ncbi:MAG: aminoacyl-tRNA hydrolase [Flavobacteriaceae bacterium]|nr:aminoacyl-tRNA hydrolase [Flavobacteriaceae bacterium]